MADREQGRQVRSGVDRARLHGKILAESRWVTQATSGEYWREACAIPDDFIVPTKCHRVDVTNRRASLKRYAFEFIFLTPEGWLPYTLFRDSLVELSLEDARDWVLREAKWLVLCSARGIVGDHP